MEVWGCGLDGNSGLKGYGWDGCLDWIMME